MGRSAASRTWNSGWSGIRSAYPKMKGFRHILQGERDRALMLKPAFKRGIGLLKKFGYTFDILIFPDQLGYTREFVAAFPDQPFIIDHIAKPYIKDRFITEEWKDAIRAVAAFPNVSCKISGMVTEADWKTLEAGAFQAVSGDGGGGFWARTDCVWVGLAGLPRGGGVCAGALGSWRIISLRSRRRSGQRFLAGMRSGSMGCRDAGAGLYKINSCVWI